jgi:hypothetical protein
MHCYKGDDENNLGQILEVLTPAQGYLMFFNNRGVTASSVVLSQTQPPFPINQFLFSQCSSFVLNTVIFRKILDRGHSYLRKQMQAWGDERIKKIVIFKLVKQMQEWGDERIKKIVFTICDAYT